ncbi:hypothetical protein ACS0TY_028650 [Phlomoides rotata]
MSFPPNLGITTSFFIDPTGSLLIQDLPSLLPQLEQICSPFSKHRMNGYSRIQKHTSARSKSLDFADLSLTHHTPRNLPKFKSHETRLNLKITTMHDSIPEETGEVFGIILSRKCSVSSGTEDQKVEPVQEIPALQSAVEKRSLSVKRSASVSESYSRIHHQADDTAAEEDEISYLNTNASKKKKKGKFLRVFKRLFGL